MQVVKRIASLDNACLVDARSEFNELGCLHLRYFLESDTLIQALRKYIERAPIVEWEGPLKHTDKGVIRVRLKISVWNRLNFLNENLVESRSEVFLTLERLQKFTCLLDCLRGLPEDVCLEEFTKVELTKDERAEFGVGLDEMLQEI